MANYSGISRLFRLAGMLAASLVIAACGGGGSGGDVPPPSPPPSLEADTTAPSTPSNVTIVATSDTSAMVTWTLSIDPTVAGATTSGMSGYQVRRCEGVSCIPDVIYASPAVNEAVFNGLTSGAVYRVAVIANDLAGNPSSLSTIAEVTLPIVPPPPPPSGDTTPPQVVSSVPAHAATGVDRSLRTIHLGMSEGVQCASGVTASLTGGGLAVPVTVACGSDAISIQFGGDLLYKTPYTVTLMGVKDNAGNMMAPYAGQFTTTPLATVTSTRLYTANSGATQLNGGQFVSSIDPGNGYAVGHITFPLAAHLTAIVADPAAGKVYGTGINTARGIDVIDVATGATTGVQFDPDPATFEYVEALAIGPMGLYTAYSNYWGYPAQPLLRNRVFRFDRLTQAELARSLPFADDAMTPVGLIVHPDPAVKRIYVLSAAKSALGTIDFACGAEKFLSGTPGVVTELDAETLVTLRTFVVGSVPMSSVIQVAANKLYVGNAGDQTISTVDFATGAVTTTPKLPAFTGCRQPVGMAFDASGRLWVANAHDGVHALNAILAETAFVTTGTLSIPWGLAFADGKLYATLRATAFSSVAEIVGITLTRTIPVGPNPYAVTAFVP